jgi:E3 ubiquitin-protein ligase synoviolin
MSPPLPFTGPPPFVPLFPPPFIPPPPLINAHNDDFLKSLLQNLTDEQLKELEGNERANVEARILLLRNIQQLLDAAVLQMNQYSTIMASMSFPKPTSSSPNIDTPSADDRSSFVPSGVQGSPHVEDEDERDRVEDIPPGSSEKRRSVDIPDSELIRQRRLQRFNSLPVTSSLNFQPQELINNNEDNDDEKDQ